MNYNLLCQIHDLKSFGAKDGNLCFQEYQIVRLRRKEKVSIDTEPLGPGAAKGKSTKTTWSFSLFGDTFNHWLEDAEDAFYLENMN